MAAAGIAPSRGIAFSRAIAAIDPFSLTRFIFPDMAIEHGLQSGATFMRKLFLINDPSLETLRELRQSIVEAGILHWKQEEGVRFCFIKLPNGICIAKNMLDAVLVSNFALTFIKRVRERERYQEKTGEITPSFSCVDQEHDLLSTRAVPLAIDRLSLEERLEYLYLIVINATLSWTSSALLPSRIKPAVLAEQKLTLCFAFSPARFKALSKSADYDPPLTIEEREAMEPSKLFKGIVWMWHIDSEERWRWVVSLVVRNKRAQVGIVCSAVAALSLFPPGLLPLIISYLPLDEGLPECPFTSPKLQALLSIKRRLQDA